MSLFSIVVDGKGFPYYLNMACNFFIVVSLINIKLENKFWKKIDNFLGDLSYPIYLIHWICAALVVWLLAKISVDVQKESLELLLYSSVLIILFSILIAKLFEEKINALRDKVKSTNK